MDRAYIKALIIIFTSSVFFSSCKKDCGCTPPSIIQSERKVLIACEGSLGNGNAALSLYLPDKDTVYENVYQSLNGMPLGDVFQSIQKIGDRFFLCINNSDKIISVDTALKFYAYLSVPKPRYIEEITASKAYVSSLFNNKIYILDPGTMSLQGTINLPVMNAEGMLLYNNKVFVCPWDTSVKKIYAINTTTDQVDDSYDISGYAPQEVLIDKENKLWVLSGNVAKGKSAAWTRIDPNTKQILKSYNFSATTDAVHPVFNKAKDTIYFIEVDYNGGTANNGIYKMSIHANDLPQQPLIQAQQFQYFWGLGIDPLSGDIYVGDPKGFIQKGSVSIYYPDGRLKKQFNTGVGPGHFYFIY